MADEAKELLLEEDKSIVEHAYTARGDQSLMDMLRHFFTRGHQGRVTCVDASAAADFVVSGGVDYTVRIWKYDITHASYDLFAILVQTPPVPLPVEEKGIFQKIWEMAFPKEIDWDDEVHSNRGITAVAPLSSRYENPFDENEKMRNGPIASGNAHGDFFLHSMYSMVTDEESGEDNCMVKGSYKCIRKLHSGAINDLAVGPLYADGEEGNTFQIATSGEDNCVKLIKVTCEELSNPNYAEPPAAPQGLEAVANFFFKGGGIVRDTGKKLEKRSSQEMVETVEDVEAAEMDDAEMDEEEEVEEVEDKYVLGLSEMSDRDSVITLTHKAPVDCCRFVGDYGKAKARFVSCTKDGVYLWSGEGACMAELSLSVERYRRAVHDKLGDWKVSLDEAGKVQKEILCCSAAWKKNGTLIFASTDCGEEKYVGVWSIKKGDPGLLNEEYSGLEYKDSPQSEREER
ncbi:unnamed protein product [Effrenium voratum]|nr:unnamed protein product [Effrenium voratum]